jgi:hypothetical protein
MLCRLSVTLESDIPFWVTKQSFYRSFDQSDFVCRNVRNVVDAYLADWFDRENGAMPSFSLPPVSVSSGVTQFISGRHRTAVLLMHLPRVPLSFDTRRIEPSDRAWIDAVVDEPIDLNATIELPDLPIRNALP